MWRKIGCAAALVLTALLLLWRPAPVREYLPGVPDGGRELLRIWTISSIGGGQAWLNKALRGYERDHPGVMTYLRTVSPDELTRADAVLPDLVLYMPGDLADPSLFAPLTGMMNAREALLRCGRWRGAQLGLPLCWGGYVLAVSASLDPEAATPAPTTLLGRPAAAEAPETTAEAGYPLEAASQAKEALQAPSGAAMFALTLVPDARPPLPETFGALDAAQVYQRYLSGQCASAMLTTGQLTALEGLASSGRAAAYRVIVPETVITDQVWLGSVVQGASPRAGELLGYLTGQDAQRLLSGQGLHPVADDLRLYAVGPAALMDRAAARSLTCINAYMPAGEVASAAGLALRGVLSLDEAILPLI